jgi:hypothetical protein
MKEAIWTLDIEWNVNNNSAIPGNGHSPTSEIIERYHSEKKIDIVRGRSLSTARTERYEFATIPEYLGELINEIYSLDGIAKIIPQKAPVAKPSEKGYLLDGEDEVGCHTGEK